MEKVAILRGRPLKDSFFGWAYLLTLTESGTNPV